MIVNQTKMDQARHFIDAAYMTEQALKEVSNWHESVPSKPLHLVDFLKEQWAARLADLLATLPVWTRFCRIYDGADSDRAVTEEEWEKSPLKWARSWLAGGSNLEKALHSGVLTDRNRRTLEQILAFSTLGGPLTAWLSAATGVELDDRGTFELAAYSAGDCLGEHQDRIEERVFAVNFYLDPHYAVGSGGRLGYRNEEGEVSYVDPLFNSVSILPIQKDSFHWVEEFQGVGRGRLTISVGQNRARGEG